MTAIYPTHTCFDDCLDLLEAFVKAEGKAAMAECRVVHAICTMPENSAEPGEPFAHGWLERGDEAYFCGIIDGEKVIVEANREDYREGLGIQQMTVYSGFDAAYWNRTSNHYGPWLPEYENLCRS